MKKEKHIERFWDILVAGNGSANYSALGRGIFGGSWKRQWVEELAALPVFAGLVTVTRERVHLSGFIPTRYILTEKGWDLARTWKLLPAQGDLPPDELRRQFERLAATLNPWAEETQRLANWARRKMAEPPPPEPKKKRHRSPAQLEKSRQWIRNKELERLRAGAVTPPRPVVQPTPSWAPTPPEDRRAAYIAPETSSGSHGNRGGF